jgi:adenylate cyclase
MGAALASSELFLFEDFRLDLRGGGLFRRDGSGAFVPVVIGSRALDILGVLAARAGEVVSKDEIIAAVWPGTVVEDSNLTVQIWALRRVLDQGRPQGSCIRTVAGRGYCLGAPVTRVETNARTAGLTQNRALSAPRLSIVVLPFANLSDDREQQYFADGITEDLTTDLSRIANMWVISRNTAFTYQNQRVATKQIGRELGVRYVLVGSVRRSGNQIRINTQLIDAETDAHLWVERFDGNPSDLFALQDEITGRIANTLNVELVTAEVARRTENPDALDDILRGRAALTKTLSRDTYAEAIGWFERALALAPDSIEAQGLLVNILVGRVRNAMTDTTAADIKRAEALAGKALAASPGNSLAHYAKAEVLRAQHRYAGAIPEYETAIAANRNWATAIKNVGQCKLLTGSVEEVIPLVEKAIRLSPRDPYITEFYFEIGRAHLLQSRTEEAIVWLEKARGGNPAQAVWPAYLASAYAIKGDLERAAAELAEARRLSPDYRYSSLARLKTVVNFGVPKVRALFEATYFAGLRKAGMPEE